MSGTNVSNALNRPTRDRTNCLDNVQGVLKFANVNAATNARACYRATFEEHESVRRFQ
jgi:hypothetical protein